ncbi:Uncharacterized protein YisK [Colletotrichum chlorophyti]|uniref:Uncharacterized protein YisK n=1 Tax=Colletotrichum chlorophyti TaxID=708187 RepID=A0A1Q8S575_9PEZI|nr:Uncharacterized protein YisK [Colletotrichum chlorophyti]
MATQNQRLTNYVSFRRQDGGLPQIGHLNLLHQTIQPLTLVSGTPIENLYQVIEAGSQSIVAAGPTIAAAQVKILPPISGRDVLAVGKNYMEHAKEFNSSGYDSSDKVDRPSHPVIFTKRATSIIADGEDIFLHKGFTESADYEGEIGVIVGKAGFRVSEENAWDYVWGYTIINDITARERQRDHKQFYIGKSPDTFCPMGPIAVPKEDLPKTLRLQTRVNGELRQNATTEELIFSIPHLISTLSAGQTLQPGDVLATGTPAGVGIGRNPPVFLRPGDEVAISIDGLGTLTNKVADDSAANTTIDRINSISAFHTTNAARSAHGNVGLTTVNAKPLNYQRIGSGKESVVFVHGIGGTKDFWSPFISTLSLADSRSLHVFDFEGHGLSPTHPLSIITVDSLAADLGGIFDLAEATQESPVTLIAHSFGCHVAIRFAVDHPELVKKLVLLGPPPSPLPASVVSTWLSTAALARSQGINAIVDNILETGISAHTKKSNPLATAAVRLSLLAQDPESFAKACSAFALPAQPLTLDKLKPETLIITGQEDAISPPSLVEWYGKKINGARLEILPRVGHWHVFEDTIGVAEILSEFI